MPSSFVVEVHSVLGVLVVVTTLGYLYTSRRQAASTVINADFKAFQWRYVAIFLLAMAADWLQGPYLYRLYEHYGFLNEQIAVLYIFGFGSSMVFGPTLGGLADRFGRRRFCVIFCFAYIISCLLHISSNFYVLILGRIFGGLSTSLLLSTFESWMVFTHNTKGFPEEWLAQTFSLATFYNGVVACISGVVANGLAEAHGHHPLRPFFLAMAVLAVCAAAILKFWEKDEPDIVALEENQPKRSVVELFRSKKVLYLGCVQAFFEAAMSLFIFLWVPAMYAVRDTEMAKTPPEEEEFGIGEEKAGVAHPPLGFIFSAFMVALMLGSCLFTHGLLMRTPVMRMGRYLLAISAASLFLCGVLSATRTVYLLLFVVFEVCCGIAFPLLGTLRSELLPEQDRARVMNVIRVPLNLVVVLFLMLVTWVPHATIFVVAALLCAMALVALFALEKVTQAEALQKRNTQEASSSPQASSPKRTLSSTSSLPSA